MDGNTLLAFLAGVGVTLTGVLAGTLAQRASGRLRRKQQARFEIYMRLLEIDSLYFWVTSDEVTGETGKPDIWKRLRSASWQVADKLREMDDVEYLDDILDVLLADSFDTACERAEALKRLIEKLGELVNPKYSQAIRKVSEQNQHRMMEDLSRNSNAPGRTHP